MKLPRELTTALVGSLFASVMSCGVTSAGKCEVHSVPMIEDSGFTYDDGVMVQPGSTLDGYQDDEDAHPNVRPRWLYDESGEAHSKKIKFLYCPECQRDHDQKTAEFLRRKYRKKGSSRN